MDEVIVSKYGGSSCASYEDVQLRKRITSDDSRRQILVVSAHGIKPKDKGREEKDTNLLIELARTKERTYVDKIMQRAKSIYPQVSENEFSNLKSELEFRVNQCLEEDAYMDSIKAFGEYSSAFLSARAYGFEFVDPRELFVFSDDFGGAKILDESEDMIVKRLGGKKGPFVVPGFYGYTKDGMVATLSRGGSDLTGSYIANALGALIYENFTDTNGISRASPVFVEKSKKIDEMTYEEIRDLAYSGFSVFHQEAMVPVARGNIPVHLRSFDAYPERGTYIVSDRFVEEDKPIVGVAYKEGFCSFDISSFGLNEMVGAGRKILGVFEEQKIPIEHITTGIDDMSVILRKEKLGSNKKDIGLLIRRLKSVLNNGSEVSFQQNLGGLVVAGKGLRGNKGISARVQQTLADSNVNIRFITQGPLERCIIYGIDERDAGVAVNSVYDSYLK
jgi:aspartate kinase